MKIAPSTEQKKPNYPVLLAAATAVASATLASCQQQQQLMGQYPTQSPAVLGDVK